MLRKILVLFVCFHAGIGVILLEPASTSDQAVRWARFSFLAACLILGIVINWYWTDRAQDKTTINRLTEALRVKTGGLLGTKARLNSMERYLESMIGFYLASREAFLKLAIKNPEAAERATFALRDLGASLNQVRNDLQQKRAQLDLARRESHDLGERVCLQEEIVHLDSNRAFVVQCPDCGSKEMAVAGDDYRCRACNKFFTSISYGYAEDLVATEAPQAPPASEEDRAVDLLDEVASATGS